MEFFIQYAEGFESRVGLRPGFFNELIQEEDWSFVIKLHTFLDACLTHTICSVLGKPELEAVIARLEMSNNQSGKLAFAKKLNILTPPQRRFISRLSQLRNELAHNAHAVDFSFEHYMNQMTEDERYQFCVALSLDELFKSEITSDEIRLISWVNEFPKIGIGCAASFVIAELFVHTSSGDLDVALTALGKHVIKLMPVA
jgi:hypothetical protein